MGNPLLEKNACLLDDPLRQQHAKLSSHSSRLLYRLGKPLPLFSNYWLVPKRILCEI